MDESEFKYEVETKKNIEGVLSTGIKGFDDLFADLSDRLEKAYGNTIPKRSNL